MTWLVFSACHGSSPAVLDAGGFPFEGELAGVRFLEVVTGGARPDEPLPMLLALHPMGGDPRDLLPQLQRFTGRARLVLPYGQPVGGRFQWYASPREDVAATEVVPATQRIDALLTALTKTRGTVGRPFVTGFSQGGCVAFALAVTHPDSVEAVFPLSGLLPTSLYPSAALVSRPRPSRLPAVMAFHGTDDLAVPVASARASIAELQRAGYTASLREYPGLAHDLSPRELQDLFTQLSSALPR